MSALDRLRQRMAEEIDRCQVVGAAGERNFGTFGTPPLQESELLRQPTEGDAAAQPRAHARARAIRTEHDLTNYLKNIKHPSVGDSKVPSLSSAKNAKKCGFMTSYAELTIEEIEARRRAIAEIARRWDELVALVGEDTAYRLTPEQGLELLADNEPPEWVTER